MASISIGFTSIKAAISNKFVVQLLDENDKKIDRFKQNQIIIAIGIGNIFPLTIELPDGVYSYPILKIRVFSENINSGIYTDLIQHEFSIDCDGNITTTSTTQSITTTTVRPTTTTKPVGTSTTTLTSTTLPITTSTTTIVTTSTTTVITTTTFPVVYHPDRGFVMGNSITHHPGVPGEWEHDYGMDAASKEQDYWHLLWTKIVTNVNPSFDFKECQDLTGLITDGPYFESSYDNLDGGIARYKAIRDYKPQYALFRLGENIDNNIRPLFVSKYVELIEYIVSLNPTCVITITNSCWPDKDNVNAACLQVYNTIKAKGYTAFFVDLIGIQGNTSGYANHPNYIAHPIIADRIYDKFPKTIGTSTTTSPLPQIVQLYAFETPFVPGGSSTTQQTTLPATTTTQALTTTTIPTTTNPSLGNAYFKDGYGEGNLSQLLQLMPFVPSGSNNWEYGVAVKYLTTNDIKVGWTKGIGGSITHMIRNNGYNRVNTNRDVHSDFEGNDIGDTGRSAGRSGYATPSGGPIGFGNPFIDPATGQRTDQDGDDTGWNPVPGGSREARDRGVPSAYERKNVPGYGLVDYIKITPYHWSLHGVLAEYDLHCFFWVKDKVLFWRFIDVVRRTDTQMIGVGRQQEFFNYVVGTLYNQKIRQGIPFTNSPLINIKKPAPCEGAGMPGCPNQTDTGIYYCTEHMIASVDDNDDGVISFMNANCRVHGKQFQGFFGNEFTNASGYQNHGMMCDLDNNGVTAFGGFYFIGTIAEFDAWALQNPNEVKRMEPDWVFKPFQKRAWYPDEAPAKFNNAGEYEFNIGQDIFCKFKSPFIAFKASEKPKLYVTAKITNGLSKLRLKWIRSTDANEDNNEIVIPCVGDGVYRTYVFDMASHPNYNGMVVQLMLGMGYNFDQGNLLNHTEKFVTSYIGFNNPS